MLLAGAAASPREEIEGDASSGIVTTPPNDAVQAAFAARSYAPGAIAILRLRGSAASLRVQIFRAGVGHEGPLQGNPVQAARAVRGTAAIRIGAWPSGFYYAKVDTPGRGTWYAPFVLRPPRLGTERVLVVLPT